MKRHDDMTMMTTPTTRGWRSNVSSILPGWSVTLVGPGQYPRYTSAAKDGKLWVAQATDKAAKHLLNTTGTRSTPKLSHQLQDLLPYPGLLVSTVDTCTFVSPGGSWSVPIIFHANVDFGCEVDCPGNLDTPRAPFLAARCSMSESPEEYKFHSVGRCFREHVACSASLAREWIHVLRQSTKLNFTFSS